MLPCSTTTWHVRWHYSNIPNLSTRIPYSGRSVVDSVFGQLNMGLLLARWWTQSEKEEYSMVRMESILESTLLNWQSTLYGRVLVREESVRRWEIRRGRLKEGFEDLPPTETLYVTCRQSLLRDLQRKRWWWESPSFVPESTLDRYAVLRPSRWSKVMKMDLSMKR